MKKNKILSILLALLIAICLWIYVVSTVTPDDSQWITNIPVTFTNEDGLFSDRNLTLTEGRDATVNLKFYGKRQDLLKLNSSNIKVTVDLSQVTGPGTWYLTYDYELPETVSSNSISLESRSRSNIEVSVDKLSVSEVEVRADFEGDVASDYVAEPIELEYDSIQISGPEDLVSSVAYAQVVLKRTNLSKTVSDTLSFTLMDADGKEVVSDEIKCTVDGNTVDKIGVMMPVYMVKEVPLTVDLISGGGATEEYAVSTITPSKVTIKGDPEQLKGINSLTVGRIDLGSVQTSVTEDFNIVIPDGMTNLTGDTATVTVELKNLKTKTFRVTNIELTNASESLQSTLGTTALQVQVRGPEDEVDALVASNIRAVADLTVLGSSKGQYKVTVDIYVDGYPDVGAMGTYSVLVTISDPVDTETAVEVSEVPTETTDTTDTGDTG